MSESEHAYSSCTALCQSGNLDRQIYLMLKGVVKTFHSCYRLSQVVENEASELLETCDTPLCINRVWQQQYSIIGPYLCKYNEQCQTVTDLILLSHQIFPDN